MINEKMANFKKANVHRIQLPGTENFIYRYSTQYLIKCKISCSLWGFEDEWTGGIGNLICLNCNISKKGARYHNI
jgi:hypothetical protein